jgi:RHH-type rel operon transcriptional repressor/antitoxin RelB
MGTFNLRLDDALKAKAFAELEKLEISPSELLRQTLEYVVVHKELPFKKIYLSNEDAKLLESAKKKQKSNAS